MDMVVKKRSVWIGISIIAIALTICLIILILNEKTGISSLQYYSIGKDIPEEIILTKEQQEQVGRLLKNQHLNLDPDTTALETYYLIRMNDEKYYLLYITINGKEPEKKYIEYVDEGRNKTTAGIMSKKDYEDFLKLISVN